MNSVVTQVFRAFNLSSRLLCFFLQVRSLESKNKLLEAEIEALRSRYARPSGLRQLYESQLKDLHRVAEQMRVQRVRGIIHNDRNIVVGCD